MRVRYAAREDVDAVLGFYHDLIERMRDNPYRPTWEKGVYPTHRQLLEAADAGTLFLAEEDSTVLGAFVLNHQQAAGYANVSWKVDAPAEKVAVLHLLGVHPNAHGKGVGTALLQKAEAVCREQNDAAIRLDTLPHNLPARRLYERFGFQSCGEIPLTDPAAGTIPFHLYEFKI